MTPKEEMEMMVRIAEDIMAYAVYYDDEVYERLTEED